MAVFRPMDLIYHSSNLTFFAFSFGKGLDGYFFRVKSATDTLNLASIDDSYFVVDAMHMPFAFLAQAVAPCEFYVVQKISLISITERPLRMRLDWNEDTSLKICL